MALRLAVASRSVLPSSHDCAQLSGIQSGSVAKGFEVEDCNRLWKGVRNVGSSSEKRRRGRSGFGWRAQATSGTQSKPAVEPVGFNDGSSTRFAPLINGCWTLAGGHGRIVESEIVQVMEMYARSGLTSFDTADIYGPSESILGAFRERWVKESEQSDGSRDVQVFTKFCPNIFRMKMTPQVVEQSIRRSMAALGVQKLDLVQMHWWDYDIPGMVDVAKSLADLREKGLITSVGVTNMSTEALAQIVDAGVPVVCNQVQFSMLDQRPRTAMLKYCEERDIKLFTYGTLAGGLLSNRYLEEGKKSLFGKVKYTTPDLNTSSLKMYWRIVREAGGEDYWRKLLSALGEIAAAKEVSISAVALRWAMQQGPVHPIVGLRNATHLDDNLTALTFTLGAAEIDKIEEVLRTSRGPSGDCYEMERS
ncbi:hypothetical protein KC19_1G188300 [Ceratodon purpureus]|uniref:NADP-dependent oxidoreductase domain-containing protein n=1 Tax=Ceratodon purpureus TaxID=3225 RepID=A0A8T0J6R5_CERPU|nr:hypothetical protein KC19_1G188300 [Ceratodon purpureus]